MNMALKPLIAICGTTGVGKSRLAVELALEVSGKVINADAMQVYQGLDVLTNKLHVNEQQGVEHLLMSFKKPGEQYVVGEWIRDAMREIDKIHAEGKVPIIVGGTTYWIHHLLFSNALPAQAGASKHNSIDPTSSFSKALNKLPENLATLYNSLPCASPSAKSDPDQAFALYTLLSLLDPPMASRWHWKDTRKVLRNLEIIKEHGRSATEVITDAYSATEQHYRALMFWLYAEPGVLNDRIGQRVDEMLSHGLLEEIRTLTRHSSENTPDLTLGVYQAIGFREFLDYVTHGETDEKVYESAVCEVKLNTSKYARRQIKWMRNKMLPALQRFASNDPELAHKAYLLDATDLSLWESNVLFKAKELTEAFLSGSHTPEPATVSDTARKMLEVTHHPTNPVDVMLSRRKVICPVCTSETDRPVMLEEGREWEAHQRTTMHRRMQRQVKRADSSCTTIIAQ